MLNSFGILTFKVVLHVTEKSSLPSFPGHGSSAEELQAVMGTEEHVALHWPLALSFVQLQSV